MKDNTKIHVVHIIPRLGFGGAERFVVDLTNFVSSKRIRQSVITLWDDAPLQKELPPGVECHSLNFDTTPRRQRISTLVTLLKKIDTDVVHTHLFSADMWGRLAARKAKIPVVTTEHNINIGESKTWGYIKRFMKNFSLVYTAPSQAVADFMKISYGISGKRVHVIPHGIDLKKFIQSEEATFTKPFTIGIIGRMVEQKGHRIALDALSFLQDIPCKLLIVGTGELEPQLKDYAKKIGISKNVLWKSPTTDIASVYRACDLVVVPSLWEGLGLVVLEAMASGRVVIASRVGGIPEIVTHGKTGVLVPSNNAKELAEAIRERLFDNAGSLLMAHQARLWATANADIHVMASRYEKIYTDIVHRSIR